MATLSELRYPEKKMKILVCGSRNFPEEKKYYLWDVINHITGMINDDYGWPAKHTITIMSGLAKGPDMWAKEWVDYTKELLGGVCEQDFEGYQANWDEFGKKAGFLRNQQMIDQNPDIVIACWDGESNGTKNTINLAKKKGITTVIIYP